MDARLAAVLRRLGRRYRRVEAAVWAVWGLMAGLALAAVAGGVARLAPLWTMRALWGAAVALGALGGAIGGIAALVRPLPAHRLAPILDRRLSLAERLTAAVEVAQGRVRTTPRMAAAQLEETLRAVSQVDPRRELPVRFHPYVGWSLAGLSLALALLLLLPNPQEAVLAERAAVRAAIEEQVERLEAERAEVEQAEGLTETDREAILQALEEAIAALEEGRTSPEEAVAALAEAERALVPLQDPGAATVREGLERAADAMGDSDLTGEIATALAQGDYGAAARALAAFSTEEGRPLTREEELELAQQLAEAAQALVEAAPELAQRLDEAARALERGDIGDAQVAIRQAAQEMEAAGQRVRRQQAVERTLAAVQEGRREVAQAAGTQDAQGAGAQGAGRPGVGGEGAQGAGAQGVGMEGVGMPGHHEDAGGGAPYDELFVPYRVEGQGGLVELGRQGEGGLPQGQRPLPVAGRSTVPYREVYAEYAAQAYATLEESYIPLGLKQYVRDYFAALEP